MRNHVLVFVALSGVVAAACGDKSSTRGDLSVSGTPTGLVEGQVRIVLAFSRPMVGKDQVGKALTAPPFAIAPPIPSEVKWQDEHTLVAVATSSVPVSTKFVVTVPGSTQALDGATLGIQHSFEFHSEQLTGSARVLGFKDRATAKPQVKLVFNHEVPFDQVTTHCAFVGAGKQLGIELAPDSAAGPGKAYTIVPGSELALDTEWTFACAAALRGSAGNLGLDKPLEERFRTYGALKLVGMKPSGNDIVPDERLRLEIAFTNPLAPPYKMTLSPTVRGFPERCNDLGDMPAGLDCPALLDPLTSYTLTIDKTQRDVFGQELGTQEVISFRTANADPTISVESGYFVAELARPVLPVWARNVTTIDVTAVRITPANFHELAPLLDWWDPTPIDLAKTKLGAVTKQVAIVGKKNEWGQHPIDPAQLLGGTSGPGMYYLELGAPEVERYPYKDGGRQKVLVNFTDIGVVSKLSGTRGLVWATQLSTGKPLPGARVTVRDGAGRLTWSGTTGADGVAVLPGADKLTRGATTEERRETQLRIYVAHKNDWTMVNPERTSGLSPWIYNLAVDWERGPTRLRGFMHTDRGLYRPGDKVHVKGLARVTKLGEPLAVPGAGKKVKVEVRGPQGKVVTETEARLSAYGGFWFDLDLPGDARLGDYVLHARLEHGEFTRSFSVEEYRPATFEVTGKAKEAQIVRRGDLHATLSANYLYGAPVRAGEVAVAVHSRPRRVKFPQHAGYEFTDERRYEYRYYDDESQTLITEDHVALDANGNTELAIAISPSDVGTDADLLVRASVTAPSNEVISKTFTVPYFHARTYYGIKAPGYFLAVKKPQKFHIVSVAPDGKLVAGPAKVTITKRDWNCVWEDWGYRGSYQCKDNTRTIAEKTLQLGAAPGEIEFTPDSGGSYWVVVEPENKHQEAATAAMQIYAWGDGGGSWESSDSLKFDIVADKKEYSAGDTATLLLQTDLAQATGLVTIERDGVIEKRLIEVTPTTKHVTVPITAAYAPNVYVSVALVQGRMGDGPRGKPRMRMGIVNLPVRPVDNRLTVTVKTDRQDYRPGDTVTATVKVTDAAGQPASAEVSIAAADEGVLSLIGYETPDPVPTFYTPWGLGVTSATQLEYLRDIPGPNVRRPATGGDAMGTLRSRFVSTALWTPGVVTDRSGVATVTFQAPDNLTAFRMMAVAADKTYRFGSADQRFTVSKPLQLHQALPRFASLGDRISAGVVVHNETGKPGTATVKLVADAHVTVVGPTERTVKLDKGARVPVLFDLTAAALGTSELAFSVTMNGESDALKLALPVQHPSPLRTQAVGHGASKDAVTLAVAPPPGAVPGSVELVVSVDPDGLSGIEEGLRELIRYPYGCLEQTTSKVIPMLAVRDLAESLAIDGVAGDKLEQFVKAGIAKIGRHQTPYGGFSLWIGGEPEAYYTAYALWGLHLAKQAGYPVDKGRIEDGLEYLRNDGRSPDTSRPYYDEHGDLGSQAFALYVRAVLGDKAAIVDATTLAGNTKLPIYGKAFVARALAAGVGETDPVVTRLVGELAAAATAATKTGGLIEEPAGAGLDYYMSSPVRTSAIVLAALVELDPKNPAIKPLVAALVKKRRTTHYFDTQQNMYSLVALTSYARTTVGRPPSITAELGDTQLLSGTLSGKQRIRVATVPLASAGELTLTPRGEVHYNVQLRYRQQPDTIAAESSGIMLATEYLDETGAPKTTYTVGDVVVVRITTELDKRASHLVVSHPLPAGFEALNARFATVGSVGVRDKQQWGTFREMMDDRVSFATEYMWNGRHVYEFTMRATSVGTFARPPTTAELMYEPTVRGQTAFDTIEVKAK